MALTKADLKAAAREAKNDAKVTKMMAKAVKASKKAAGDS